MARFALGLALALSGTAGAVAPAMAQTGAGSLRGSVKDEQGGALPGVSEVQVDDHVLRLRVSGAITPVVQAAARYELLDFVSREPSLEETFLAQYGQQAVEVNGHGR